MENKTSVNQNSEKKLLREIRKDLGITQDQMAQALGVHRQRISDIELGKTLPDWLVKAVRLNKILKQAGYSLDDIALPSPPSKN